MRDSEYSNFNRWLQLVDKDTAESIKSLTIKPGEEELVCFAVKGDRTWYDSHTFVYFKFKYDGIYYMNFSIRYTGDHYEKYDDWIS